MHIYTATGIFIASAERYFLRLKTIKKHLNKYADTIRKGMLFLLFHGT